MAKIDLHVHSHFSDHPSEWFLQRIGANESYTMPETVYTLCKKRGMDFVTITDHNDIRGARALHEQYPDEVCVGVEATTYFPEDGCKIHVLLYGISDAQFDMIQQVRKNIYALREYIAAEDIAYVVAHATYAINDRLTRDHMEKLILLFDVFEGINGSRAKMSNNGLMSVLGNLTPDDIERMSARQGIAPFGATAWEKGLTGGSDDHAGLFMGHTYTTMDAACVADVIAAIKDKRTFPAGRHNDYRSLAFTLYKIAYDFSRTKSNAASRGMIDQITRALFEGEPLRFRDKMALHTMRTFGKKDTSRLYDALNTLRKALHEKNNDDDIDEKFSLAYDTVAEITDACVVNGIATVTEAAHKGELAEMLQCVSASLPALFLSLPFFSTLRHMCRGRSLITELLTTCHIRPQKSSRLLCFTDSMSAQDAAGIPLKEMRAYARAHSYTLRIMTTDVTARDMPDDVSILPAIYSFTLPSQVSTVWRIPSVLKVLQMIYEYDPDDIMVVTPGPMGVLGMIAGRLLHVRTTGLYHDTSARMALPRYIDDGFAGIMHSYLEWFYASFDRMRVPSTACLDHWEKRGVNRAAMSLFYPHVPLDVFHPQPIIRTCRQQIYGIHDGVTLCYVRQAGDEEIMTFIMELYGCYMHTRYAVNLLIISDKVADATSVEAAAAHTRVYHVHAATPAERARLYNAAEYLLFPDPHDMCAMSLLEALACGVPVIAVDTGATRSHIVAQETGIRVPAFDLAAWRTAIETCITLCSDNEQRYTHMRQAARTYACRTCAADVTCATLLNGEIDATATVTPQAYKDTAKEKAPHVTGVFSAREEVPV